MNEERFELTKKAGIWGIIGNIFLLVIKAIVGFVFKSQSMIADSFNSAGDIFASLMTFIGNKIARVPNDEDHNFGHGKAEYIFSMFIGISMILVAVKLFFNSISTLILGSKLEFSWLLIVVCIVTIIIKFSLFLYTKKAFKKYNNILLESNMKDHKNDCIVTSFTLVSIVLSLFGIYWFDSVVGIGISIWIGYTGISILLESYNVLMDVSIDEKTKDLILDIVNSFSEVKMIDSISSSPVGAQYIVFITVCVDGNLSTFDSHCLANNIEILVSKLNNVYRTIVHIEPA